VNTRITAAIVVAILVATACSSVAQFILETDWQTPGPTGTVHMTSIAATPENIFDAAVAALAQKGFALKTAEKGAQYSIEATKPYAETGCEALRMAEGEWRLVVNVNPPDFPPKEDRVTLMLGYEETKVVLDARKAEDLSGLEQDCLSNQAHQITKSIDEAATSTDHAAAQGAGRRQ
jgi:hypothetical protein